MLHRHVIKIQPIYLFLNWEISTCRGVLLTPRLTKPAINHLKADMHTDTDSARQTHTCEHCTAHSHEHMLQYLHQFF